MAGAEGPDRRSSTGARRFPPCEVSIVVPTEGRVDLVERLLESVAAARGAVAGGTECLIVDSSSGDEAAQIEELCRRFGATFVAGTHNVREKRNLGAALAGGRFLHFVDSDCWLAPEAIAACLEVARREGGGGAVGLTLMAGTGSWATRVAEASPFLDAFAFALEMDEVPWATMTNCMIERTAFDAVGGFDEQLPFRLGGDDLDLTWRLNQAGHVLRAAPTSVVFHGRETWTTFSSVRRRVRRWGSVEAHLRVKHRDHVAVVAPALPVWIALTVVAWAAAVGWKLPAQRPAGAMAVILLVGFLHGEVRAQRSKDAGSVTALPAIWLLQLDYWVGKWSQGWRTGCRPFTRLFYESPYLQETHLVYDVPRQAASVWWVLVAALAAALVGQ